MLVVRIKDASRKCIVLMKFYCPLFPRIVCGEPTVTVRPKTEQNFRRNEQADGGAYVPRLKSTAQETEFATEVLHRVRVTLAECENKMHMSGDSKIRADVESYLFFENK